MWGSFQVDGSRFLLRACWPCPPRSHKALLQPACPPPSSHAATHTVSHVGNPTAEENVGARTWLANATGIPESKISGFR